MPRNREETVRIDGRLAVLGGDDDGGGIQELLVLERGHHLPDRRIHESNLTRHAGGRITRGVGVTAFDAVLDQFLADADSLEVHAKYCRDRSVGGAEVVFALDPIHHRIDLQLVVAFDGIEVGGPVAAGVCGNIGAVLTVGCLETRDVDYIGIDFRRVVIVDVAGIGGSGGSGNDGIDRVLVGPGGEAAYGVDYAVNCVSADEVPGVNGVAAIEGIALELLRVDR